MFFTFCSDTDAPPVPAVFEMFEPVSLSLLSEVVQGMSPTNCPLDIIPTKMLKQVFDTVGPCVLVLINICLSLGIVPTAFKHAVVRPLLKKTTSILTLYLILDLSLIYHFYQRF